MRKRRKNKAICTFQDQCKSAICPLMVCDSLYGRWSNHHLPDGPPCTMGLNNLVSKHYRLFDGDGDRFNR